MKKLIGLLIVFLVSNRLQADTFNVVDSMGVPTCINGTAGTDYVQQAVDLATVNAGPDIVIIPACTGTDWTAGVNIPAQELIIQGAGLNEVTAPCTSGGNPVADYLCPNLTTGNTIIYANAGSTPPLTINLPSSGIIEVKGLEFRFKSTNLVNGLIHVVDTSPYTHVGFRIHDNIFYDSNLSVGSRLITVHGGFGSIDHNYLKRDSTLNVQHVDVYGTQPNQDSCYSAQSLAYDRANPTNQAVVIENNYFYKSAFNNESIVENYCGRTITRFNTVINGHTGSHGVDSGRRYGPQFQEELYNAYFSTVGSTATDTGTVRGGTALFIGNTHTRVGGPNFNGIQLVYYRATGDLTLFSNWGYCNGTHWDVKRITPLSAQDITTMVPEDTGVARFLSTTPSIFCTYGAGNCTRFLDGTGTDGYPCRNQAGRGPNEVLMPVYEVDNTWPDGQLSYFWNQVNCVSPLCMAGNTLEHWIALNRDVYSYIAYSSLPSDGQGNRTQTTGVSSGTRTQMDTITTCTEGVAFLVSDEGTWNTSSTNEFGVQRNGADGQMYQCGPSNDWNLYYVPLEFPNPLVGTGLSAPPTVEITSPSSDYETTTDTVDLVGNALDDVGISTLDCTNSAPGSSSCTATGTAPFTVTDAPLVAGVNTFGISATDADGQIVTASRRVYYTPIPASPSDSFVATGGWNSLGANWEQTFNSLRINASNQVYAYNGNFSISKWLRNSLGDDQFFEISIKAIPNISDIGYAFVRISGSGASLNGDACIAYQDSIVIAELINGQINYLAVIPGITWNIVDNLRASVSGDTISCLQNGTVKGTATVTLTSGGIGIGASGNMLFGSFIGGEVSEVSDLEKPVVQITLPTDKVYYVSGKTPQPFGVTATDNIGVSSCTYTNDRGGSGSLALSSGIYRANVALFEGENKLTGSCVDAAGNSTSDEQTILLLVPNDGKDPADRRYSSGKSDK